MSDLIAQKTHTEVLLATERFRESRRLFFDYLFASCGPPRNRVMSAPGRRKCFRCGEPARNAAAARRLPVGRPSDAEAIGAQGVIRRGCDVWQANLGYRAPIKSHVGLLLFVFFNVREAAHIRTATSGHKLPGVRRCERFHRLRNLSKAYRSIQISGIEIRVNRLRGFAKCRS
jgi:hypothetical protein